VEHQYKEWRRTGGVCQFLLFAQKLIGYPSNVPWTTANECTGVPTKMTHNSVISITTRVVRKLQFKDSLEPACRFEAGREPACRSTASAGSKRCCFARFFDGMSTPMGVHHPSLFMVNQPLNLQASSFLLTWWPCETWRITSKNNGMPVQGCPWTDNLHTTH